MQIYEAIHAFINSIPNMKWFWSVKKSVFKIIPANDKKYIESSRILSALNFQQRNDFTKKTTLKNECFLSITVFALSKKRTRNFGWLKILSTEDWKMFCENLLQYINRGNMGVRGRKKLRCGDNSTFLFLCSKNGKMSQSIRTCIKDREDQNLRLHSCTNQQSNSFLNLNLQNRSWRMTQTFGLYVLNDSQKLFMNQTNNPSIMISLLSIFLFGMKIVFYVFCFAFWIVFAIVLIIFLIDFLIKIIYSFR